MHFNMDNLLNKDNLVGAVPVNSEQQMYNAYGYLCPGIWTWPQQQLGQQEGYQAPWTFNAYQNEQNGSQVRHKLEGLRDHSRVDSADGYGTYSASDSNSPGKIFGEHAYPMSNGYQHPFQFQSSNPGPSYIGKDNADLGSTSLNESQPECDAVLPPSQQYHQKPKGRSKGKCIYGPFKRVSPYGLFFTENHSEIRKSNPSATFGEVSRMVGIKWRAEDEDVKNSYRNRVNQAKEFYMKAMAAYLGNPAQRKSKTKLQKKRKNNGLPSIHTKDENTQTKKEVNQQAGTSTTYVDANILSNEEDIAMQAIDDIFSLV